MSLHTQKIAISAALLAALAPTGVDANTIAYQHDLNAQFVEINSSAYESEAKLLASAAPFMVGDYGIDQLEDITDAFAVAGQVYAEAMADGKITVFDAFNLPKLIEPLNAVNEGKELTGKQAFDIYDAECEALIESTVRKAERLTDNEFTLDIVKQVSRIGFGSLCLASSIRRRQAVNAAA